jgi:hypothetical protein
LSIGFEALLGLPSDQKTDRLTDAISLLLGRVPRLDWWARQFYDARSAIAHEGKAENLRFVAAESKKQSAEPALYRPLLSYARHIFQLCVGSLLFGAKLAEEAGLEEKFVTNEERFKNICKLFDEGVFSSREKLVAMSNIVGVLERYRFISETLDIDAMLSSGRSAAKALLECDTDLESGLKAVLEGLASAKRSADNYETLDALRQITELPIRPSGEIDSPKMMTFRLLGIIWGYLFMRYYQLKKHRENEQEKSTGKSNEEN